MIAKHIAMTSAKRSSFRGLVNYLIDHQGNDVRVGKIETSNCHSEEAIDATLEVMGVQSQNLRAKSDKTFHLLVSFRPGEEVDNDRLSQIETEICEGLGFGEHQRVSVVHRDTDNLHFHIAINKIHPNKLTLHEPYYSHKKIADLCEELEQKHSLQIDNHRPEKNRGATKANDMEAHAHVESLAGWIKRECSQELSEAASWKEFHNILGDRGLSIEPRGNGLVFTDGQHHVRASAIGREFSKAGLEARLQEFVPLPDALGRPKQTKAGYKPKPLQSGRQAQELYERYLKERDDWKAAMPAERHRLVKRQIAHAKTKARFMRALINVSGAKGPTARLLYALSFRALKKNVEQVVEREKTSRKAATEIQPTTDRQRPVWGDWLKRQAQAGDPAALAALRKRSGGKRFPSTNWISGEGVLAFNQNLGEGARVTKSGSITFQAGGEKITTIGSRVYLAGAGSNKAISAALHTALSCGKSPFNVQGSSSFKQAIAKVAGAERLDLTFAAPKLEKVRLDTVTLSDVAKIPDKLHSHKVSGAEIYIAERESKRLEIVTIPVHRKFESADAGRLKLSGRRTVQGQPLALLEKGKDIIVLPIDWSTAKALKALKVGDHVSLSRNGAIRLGNRDKGHSHER